MSDALLSDADVGLTPTGGAGPKGGLMSDADVGIAPASSTAKDVLGGAAAGFVNDVSDLAALPRTMKDAADYGGNWLIGKGAQWAGMLPEGQTASDYASGAMARKAAILNSSHAPQWPSSTDVRGAISSLGAPDYEPQTTAGKYAKTVGSFIPSALTMPAKTLGGIGANAIKYGVVPGVASEFGGQATEGTAAEPYARGAGALLGGVGADLATAGAKAGTRAVGSYIEPMGAKGQEAVAARMLKGAFTDPQAAQAELAKADALRTPGAAMGEIVPGAKPTTGQLTGDLGALSLERELATKQPDLAKANPFGTGSEQQNAARVDALRGVQPDGSPEAIGNTVRQRLADIEAEHDAALAKASEGAQAASENAANATSATAAGADASQTAREAAARQVAQEAASGIGTGATPEAVGANMRQALQTAWDSAKAKAGALWKAVDPDNTLSMHTWDVSGAANDIKNSIESTAKSMKGEEAEIFDTASNLPDMASFNSITALRSRVSDAMRKEFKDKGSSASYRRLAQLRGAIEDSISSLIESKAAGEAQAVARGELSPNDTISARLKAQADEFKGARSEAAGAVPGRNNLGNPGEGSSGVRTAAGTEGQSAGRSGNVAGSEGVSGTGTNGTSASVRPFVEPTAGAAPKRPQSLLSFLIQKGGVRNQGGELTDYIRQYPGLVNNKRGMTLDAAREAAAEAGYLGGDTESAMSSTTPAHLLEALPNSHNVYSAFDEAQLLDREAHAGARTWIDRVKRHADDVDAFARQYNLGRLDPEHRWVAAELMAEQGMSADDALDRAAMELYHRDADVARANGEAVYVPGSKIGDERGQGTTGKGNGPGQQSNVGGTSATVSGAGKAGEQSKSRFNPVDEAAAKRLKAATAATKEEKETFGKGAIRDTLARDSGKTSPYTAPASAIPAKHFVPGAKGAEIAQAFGKAAGTMQPVMDAASESLREAAVRNDVIDPRLFDRWHAKYKNALRAFPELQTKFENAASASRALAEHEAIRANTVKPLQDAAASLSSEVMKDGVIDPRAFARWQSHHADAIAAMPADVRAKLADVESASRAVSEAAEARKMAIDEHQKSAAGEFLNLTDPSDITKTVGGMIGAKDGVRQMAGLASKVAGNPEAQQGLRKAVVDAILARVKSTTESGASGVEALKPDALLRYLRENRNAIKAAGFSDRELGSMQAVAEDLRRGQRTLNATRLAGQSNTAQDIIKAIEAGNSSHHVSLLNKIALAAGAGWEAHGIHGAMIGAALGGGQHVIAGMRNAGLTKANMMVRDAMLNPELALALLRKAPVTPGRGSEYTFAKMLARNSVFASEVAGRDNKKTMH